MSHDPRCHQLARVFLQMPDDASDDAHVEALAESIQQGIEDWLKARDVYRQNHLTDVPVQPPTDGAPKGTT